MIVMSDGPALSGPKLSHPTVHLVSDTHVLHRPGVLDGVAPSGRRGTRLPALSAERVCDDTPLSANLTHSWPLRGRSLTQCYITPLPPHSEPSGGASGQASDIAIHAREILKVRERLTAIYTTHCRRDVEAAEDAARRFGERVFLLRPCPRNGCAESGLSQRKRWSGTTS